MLQGSMHSVPSAQELSRESSIASYLLLTPESRCEKQEGKLLLPPSTAAFSLLLAESRNIVKDQVLMFPIHSS